MESPAKHSGRQRGAVAAPRRLGSRAENQVAASALGVTSVVQYGRGQGSRIDLTVAFGDVEVALTGVPAKDVLSYGRIRKRAMEQGVCLPWLRSGNRVWSEALSVAVENARFEPSLEGEEIAEAIAAEIRTLLASCPRGNDAAGLLSGKVVVQAHRLLVSPTRLAQAVRSRLVDDVLAQATIGEAAASQLGMRESRPRLGDGRPRCWSFPLPLPGARDLRHGFRRRPPSAGETEVEVGPVHGPRLLSRKPHSRGEMRAGSTGPRENESESLEPEATALDER